MTTIRNLFPVLSTLTPRLYWWHAGVGYATALIAALGMTLLAITFAHGETEKQIQESITNITTQLLPWQYLTMFALGVLFIRLWRGRKYRNEDIGFVSPQRLSMFLYGVAGAILFVIISHLGGLLFPDIAEAGKKVAEQVNMGGNFTQDLIIVLSATIAAPLGEELIYRVLIFRGLHDQMLRLKNAIAVRLAFIVPAFVSAVLFAVSHGGEGQEKQIPFLVLYGLIMAWLYWSTNSYYVPVFAHAVTNSINFFLLSIAATASVHPVIYVIIFIAPFAAIGIVKLVGRLITPTQVGR